VVFVGLKTQGGFFVLVEEFKVLVCRPMRVEQVHKNMGILANYVSELSNKNHK
jgi:hypothetical protein